MSPEEPAANGGARDPRRNSRTETPSPARATNPVLEQYGALASDYDRRWAFYIDATVRETLRRLDLKAGECVLDVGCGTGVLLGALAASVPGARLSGADCSPEMLAEASKRLGAAIDLTPGSAESLPYSSGEFDVVVSTNAFHHFQSPLAALEEMARVTRLHGRLVITDWCHDFIVCRIFELWHRLFDRAHFQTYGQERCRQLLEEAGFRVVRLDRYKINWRWGLMTVVARKHAES